MSSVFETMEFAEISQRLAFLDAERRKDKEVITTLMERMESQKGLIDAQRRQLQELEGLLANTRAELVKFTQIERSMEQLREELTLLIEANEEKRERSYQELVRLRQVEQEAITREIGDVRKELKPIPQYDEEIQRLQAEVSRLNPPIISLQHQLTELEKRSDDRVQSVVYLEEQRRQDNRRITEMESEIPALKKQMDDWADKSLLLEQAIQTKNKDIARAAELLDQQTQVIENQRVSEFRWERKVADWAKLVEELKQETASMTTQTVRLREQHQLVRRALADLDPFRERIERRQNEMAEVQRLAEDRQKRTMEEWQTERQKQWDRFKLDSDERWRENARFNEQRHARLEAVEQFVRQIAPQIEALWDVHKAWAESFMVGPREWASTWSELVKQRPPMPEPPKPVTIVPVEMPKIKPLPSAQATEDREEED